MVSAFISDSAVEVETLPCSVEHQHIKEPPKYPKKLVCECLLSSFPAKSASHWKRNCNTSVIVWISYGPSLVLKISRSILEYLTNLTRCYKYWICLGPGLLLYLDSTFSAYIIVTIVWTIPYISCPTTLLYGYLPRATESMFHRSRPNVPLFGSPPF